MDNENTVQTVTILIETEIDPVELLDIIIGMKGNIIERIEQQCIKATILEEEISVECGKNVYGGFNACY